MTHSSPENADAALLDLQRRSGIPHLPTQMTYEARLAVSNEGPRAYDWQDKPHRLVYDLCREIERLSSRAQQMPTATEEMVKRVYDAAWKIDLPLTMDEIRCLLLSASSPESQVLDMDESAERLAMIDAPYGKHQDEHEGVILECNYFVPGLTLHDLTMIFEKASKSEGVSEYAADPSKWPVVRGVQAVADACINALAGKGSR